MMKRLLAQVTVLVVGALALVGLGGVSHLLDRHADVAAPVVAVDTTSAMATMQVQLNDTRRELERAHQVLEFSGRYAIPADLSALIYDHAVAEGVPASIAFQLVKIESDFKNSAQSDAAVALGLTQLRLSTARAYEPALEASDLLNPDVSLRIGFRYLKDLIKRFGDNALALEAYNKGPSLVASQQDDWMEVRGRYSKAVLAGLRKGS